MATIQDDRSVKFLSVLEAAKLLRVSPRTVYGRSAWSPTGRRAGGLSSWNLNS